MGLLDRIRRDRRLWAAAQTIDELAELTARWLAGEIQSQPGYYGPVDVDERYAPGLTDTLISLNRAGYLTDCSQAGFDGTGQSGRYWQQRATVEGFAELNTAQRLYRAIEGTRFKILEDVRRGRRDIEFSYHACSPAALAALRDSWQITIYDPVIGSNDLWPVLAAAAVTR